MPPRMVSVWPRFVQTVKAERIHVGALLQHTTPLEVNADDVVIGVPDEFHLRLLNNQHAFLLDHLRAVDQDTIRRLTFIVHKNIEPSTSEEATPEIDPQEYMQQKRKESPVVQAIFDQFGGELVW